MRVVANLAWVIATSIAACLFWVTLAQVIFVLTDTDSLAMFSGSEIRRGAIMAFGLWVVGVLIYAAIAHAKFRFEQSRKGVADHG